MREAGVGREAGDLLAWSVGQDGVHRLVVAEDGVPERGSFRICEWCEVEFRPTWPRQRRCPCCMLG
jgi:hypothetical protein